MLDEHRGCAQEGTENICHREVASELRRQHAQSDQSGTHQPVAGICREQQAKVRAAENQQHNHVTERKDQCHGINRDVGHVFAGYDLKIGRRQGEQQLVRPGRHRQCWNEENQQVREVLVERVQIGEVASEEGFLPERRHGA